MKKSVGQIFNPSATTYIENSHLICTENQVAGFYMIRTLVATVLMADIFNLPFSSGVFPSLLKITKVVPIYKKDSKSNIRNNRPISLLSNIDKILEKLMHQRLDNFQMKITYCMSYSSSSNKNFLLIML